MQILKLLWYHQYKINYPGGYTLQNLKLIATDIDGTLFDSDHNFDHQRLNKYLDQLHQQDVKFVVASGNGYCHLAKIFEQVPNVDAFIAENGAQTVVNGKTIDENIFDHDVVNQLLEIITDKFDINKIYLSGKNGTYTTKTDFQDDTYYFNNLVYVDKYQDVDDEIFKINLDLDEKIMYDTVAFLNDNYNHLLHAAVSGFGCIDTIPAHTNKGTALQDLSDYYQLQPENLVAFGDNNNDLEMIKLAGTGVAMKNGIQQIKDHSKLITKDDNDHDGVLNTIQELFQLDDD